MGGSLGELALGVAGPTSHVPNIGIGHLGGETPNSSLTPSRIRRWELALARAAAAQTAGTRATLALGGSAIVSYHQGAVWSQGQAGGYRCWRGRATGAGPQK